MPDAKARSTVLTVLGSVFLLVAVVSGVLIYIIKSKADTATQNISAGEVSPEVDSITAIDQGAVDIINATLTPLEGQTNTVTVTANVSDANGCEDLSSVVLVMARSNYSAVCDAAHAAQVQCYYRTVSKAQLTGCASGDDTTAVATFSVPVANFADPTDPGSPEGDLGHHWTLIVKAFDTSGQNGTATRSFDVASLAAFSTGDLIDYGTLSLGEVSASHTLIFLNTGNRLVDADVVAVHHDPPYDPAYPPIDGDMHSSLGPSFAVIPAARTHYSMTNGFTYHDVPGEGEAALSKTDSQTLALGLPQQRMDGAQNIPTVDTYWRMKMPDDGINGTYQNTVSFTAKARTSSVVYQWTERQPLGNQDIQWNTLASNSTGSRLIAAVNNGRVYLSTDSGASWSETRPAGDVDRSWGAVASDGTGGHLVAAANGGRIYVSADGGASWSEVRPAGDADRYWSLVAMDSGGSHILVGMSSGRLYVTSDGGTSWAETRPAGNTDQYWRSLAMDIGGSIFMAAARFGRVYISTDGGTSWSETRPAGDADLNWQVVGMDAAGTRLLAGIDGGRLYRSTDGGSSWSEARPAGDVNKAWWVLASDSLGQHVLAANWIGNLYGSANYGNTWATLQVLNENDSAQWQAAALSTDGIHAFVATKPGRLYTGVLQP